MIVWRSWLVPARAPEAGSLVSSSWTMADKSSTRLRSGLFHSQEGVRPVAAQRLLVLLLSQLWALLCPFEAWNSSDGHSRLKTSPFSLFQSTACSGPASPSVLAASEAWTWRDCADKCAPWCVTFDDLLRGVLATSFRHDRRFFGSPLAMTLLPMQGMKAFSRYSFHSLSAFHKRWWVRIGTSRESIFRPGSSCPWAYLWLHSSRLLVDASPFREDIQLVLRS